MRVFERGSTIKTREKNLCISCELCVAICPASAIKMIYDGGQFVPQVDTNICNNCGECLDVCPGIDIDLKIDVGSCIESFSAYAKDMDVLLNSTSGGLITQLVIDLLKNDEYKGAFLLNFDMFNGEPARLDLVTGEDDVKKASKSKYLPASVYNVVNTLKSTKNPNYIIVGTPCQIKGIKKYIGKRRIDDKNILFLGLFCDKTLNFNMLNYFERKFSRENEKLKKFNYKNKENLSSLGNPKLYFHSGREISVDRSERMKVKDYFQLERCIYCTDKLNQYADISFSDCYIVGKENPHRSNIIIRTERGNKTWQKYSNLFEFEKVSFESIKKSQKISKKKENLEYATSLVKGKKTKKLKKILRKIEIGRKNKFKLIKIVEEQLKNNVEYAVNGLKIGLVISLEYLKDSFRHKKVNKRKKKNIIIFGGQLFNKGAQAMTFTVVDQMKQKYPNKEIYLFSKKDFERDEIDKSHYNFRILPCEIGTLSNLIYGKSVINLEKVTSNLKIENQIKELIHNAMYFIDISGYGLSSQIKSKGKSKSISMGQYHYLMRIMLAKKLSIPYFILPQSLGPFDYGLIDKLLLFPLMNRYLKYPKKIYVREHQGIISLAHFTKNNVERERDIVLLNNGYILENIFNDDIKLNKKDIKPNSVGIIPNKRVMERCKEKDVYLIYKTIIKKLLKIGKKVYVLRHSQEDLDICREIKKMFLNDKDVILLIDDFNAIELEHIIKQFDFIIASRYHSIIHAYKNGIPSITIGWALKYEELLRDFDQLKYLFDVRDGLNEKELYNCLKKMIEKYESERKTIILKVRNFDKNVIFNNL
jgi:coenzyme F420-reducing hydrogenase beta subunit/polysaccharide pyruvyl transferase WcaK-like protein